MTEYTEEESEKLRLKKNPVFQEEKVSKYSKTIIRNKVNKQKNRKNETYERGLLVNILKR